MRPKIRHGSHRYDINRTRPRHQQKCTQNVPQYDDGYVQQAHLKLNS